MIKYYENMFKEYENFNKKMAIVGLLVSFMFWLKYCIFLF